MAQLGLAWPFADPFFEIWVGATASVVGCHHDIFRIFWKIPGKIVGSCDRSLMTDLFAREFCVAR